MHLIIGWMRIQDNLIISSHQHDPMKPYGYQDTQVLGKSWDGFIHVHGHISKLTLSLTGTYKYACL